MSEIIRLESVVKMYDNGTRAINSVSLSISERECIMISGPPGSGKTTLMRLIAGLDRPSAGQVFVLDKPVHAMGADAAADFRNKNIGILQRAPAFLDNLTVLENVALPLTLRGEAPAKRAKKAKEQLKILGLQYTAHAHPPQLSPLERHKAAMARALIAQPKILLLDDFAADIEQTDEIAGSLHALCQYGNYTVIELTGADKALICTDSTIQLDHGKLQEGSK